MSRIIDQAGQSFPASFSVVGDAREVGEEAARFFVEVINNNPRANIGLATGATARSFYTALIKAHTELKLSFAAVNTFNLDEYIGLSRSHPNSYWNEIVEQFGRHVDVPLTQIHAPDGAHQDPEAAAAVYEGLLASVGGVDIQLLGLGRNGHIAFNEPGSPFDSCTRPVDLTTSTLQANQVHFPSGETMPQRAISMGIATILKARRIVLIASGQAKAEALKDMLRGTIGPHCPASFLRAHSAVHVIADRDAARLVTSS
ncbi:glucosamine-6-phosphate deaminase [Rhizobium lemnae]|uniref:Glucosamine-6-phosphate deaminase n=1 Tax=Rhizobium lemnae TaxID=1214924 RepID=A0ABV8EE90_9HYPH|nr:glucosamine-6-phosphate deaminase [Rhizobium lemnae]MCJ8508677.1 glucosamine-6-phosphate deaminase [Rhizobium lemnae]